MNRKIRVMSIFLLIIFICTTPISAQSLNGIKIVDKNMKDMMVVSENSNLKLYFHPNTTEIAVEDKNNDTIWYSNPELNEGKLSGNAADYSKSQFVINYITELGQVVRMDNYKYSIKNKQYEYEKIPNGIKVHYQIGDNKKNASSFPKIISMERMNKLIFNNISEKSKKYIKRLYRYVEEKDVYCMRKNGENGNNLSKIEIKKLAVIMYDEAGYTEEDLKQDNIENGITSENNKPFFEVTIEYILDGEYFTVRIPNESIKYKNKFPIESINVLEYFGAASPSDKGYMFVPDGSGALIYLNNGKKNCRSYSYPIYGYDKALKKEQRNPLTEKASLPVFGLKTQNGAFIAFIESGAEMATVNADISGRTDNFNKISSSYKYKNFGSTELIGGKSKQTVMLWSKVNYAKDIQLKYAFLSKDKANYVQMAKKYQQYLIERYGLSKLKPEDTAPFYLDVIGSFVKKKFFIGIPYMSVDSITNFDQTIELLDKLKADGITNIVLRYKGWFNKGIHHTSPKRISIDKVLGGNKGFNKLLNYTKENDIKFYPDVAFTNVYYNNIYFNPRKEAARFLDGNIAKLYPYNLATKEFDKTKKAYYDLSPIALTKTMNKFIKSYDKLNISTLSLRDLGNSISSDFKGSNQVLRDKSLEMQIESLKELSKKYSLMCNNPNIYTAVYSKHAINIPFYSSCFQIIDENIPFYQLVLNGYVNYSSTPANTDADEDFNKYLMKSLETGSALHFAWSYENTLKLKNTEYDNYFSTYYIQSFEDAVSMYQQYNKIYNQIKGLEIVGHQKIDNDVYMTSYENNVKIITNYSNHIVKYNNNLIEAQSYKVVKGGE